MQGTSIPIRLYTWEIWSKIETAIQTIILIIMTTSWADFKSLMLSAESTRSFTWKEANQSQRNVSKAAIRTVTIRSTYSVSGFNLPWKKWSLVRLKELSRCRYRIGWPCWHLRPLWCRNVQRVILILRNLKCDKQSMWIKRFKSKNGEWIEAIPITSKLVTRKESSVSAQEDRVVITSK